VEISLGVYLANYIDVLTILTYKDYYASKNNMLQGVLVGLNEEKHGSVYICCHALDVLISQKWLLRYKRTL
jgi:hypothetical protein